MSSSGTLEQVIHDRASLIAVKELENKLRRHQIVSTEAIAEATAKTVRTVISATKVWQLDELVRIIRIVGHHLQNAHPFEPVIGNVTRRILYLLREEVKALTTLGTGAASAGAEAPSSSGTARTPPHPSVVQSLAALSMSMPASPASSMHASFEMPATPAPNRSFSISDLVFPSSTVATPPTCASAQLAYASDVNRNATVSPCNVSSPLDTPSQDGSESPQRMSDSMSSDDDAIPVIPSHAYQLKPLLIQAIQELLDEFESVDTSIAKDARDHIHSGEVILTLGYSTTVQTFLRAAAKHRKFIAVVPESAPSFVGHEMARALAADGLSVLLVPDSNVYALMPRVSKVILGARCVLANGGILASIGAKAISMAAREHSTPVVALAGVFKISPDWSWVSPERLRTGNQGPTAQLVNYASSHTLAEKAEIENPLWDFVSPADIDVIITNVGEHPPSYVYRLIQENYHEEDLNL